MPIEKKKAIALLNKMARSYDLAMRAEYRALKLTGYTTKALAERDKATAYIEAAVVAELELRDLILNS